MISFFLRFLLLCTLLIVSCAHQSAPGGGPEDLTPPVIISTYPAQGQTAVGELKTIHIDFSKWIAPASAPRSVSIYPPLSENIRVNTNRQRLEIALPEPLKDSTTYHVVINNTLRCIRGNNLSNAYNLIFSTGAQLDSATVSGCIIEPNVWGTFPKIGLFRVNEEWHDSLFFSAPDYLTQADSAGRFSLSHLQSGSYRLLAFEDRNNTGRLIPEQKTYAPVDSIIYLSNDTQPYHLLFPVSSDTASAQIPSVTALSTSIIQGAWNRPFNTQSYQPSFKIQTATDSSIEEIAIESVYMMQDKKNFIIKLKDSLTNAAYQLTYSYGQVEDSVRFNGVTRPDTVNPVLQRTAPQEQADLSPALSLTFSKPVRIEPSGLTLIDSTLEDTVGLKLLYDVARTHELTTTRNLKPSAEYTLTLPVSSVRDLSGNLLDSGDEENDSTVIVTFNSIHSDSIAFKMHGGSPCLDPDSNRIWIYSPLNSSQKYYSADSAGFFSFDSLPASRGTISFFIDNNDNSKHDAGKLSPWRAPEPLFELRDTIEARARWEVENIPVDACTVCPPEEVPIEQFMKIEDDVESVD
ncbi:Ig-like domain-containing protein [Chitinispirillales bacterium ANBcel5]|uniref:Ig-like domain-containing protein n=1 Tax=Cellulosispirillum alkaliphilum TaxID=3039283 RepID=UPI002A4E6033|nr:Ig-like domain-containing protein [Chitinispirillales bacterium ANBcel5]